MNRSLNSLRSNSKELEGGDVGSARSTNDRGVNISSQGKGLTSLTTLMTTEMTLTSFNLDGSIKEMVLLTEEEVWL